MAAVAIAIRRQHLQGDEVRWPWPPTTVTSPLSSLTFHLVTFCPSRFMYLRGLGGNGEAELRWGAASYWDRTRGQGDHTWERLLFTVGPGQPGSGLCFILRRYGSQDTGSKWKKNTCHLEIWGFWNGNAIQIWPYETRCHAQDRFLGRFMRNHRPWKWSITLHVCR